MYIYCSSLSIYIFFKYILVLSVMNLFNYHTYHLLKLHSYTFLQPKSNFYGKLNAVALFEKDASVLSNQNT